MSNFVNCNFAGMLVDMHTTFREMDILILQLNGFLNQVTLQIIQKFS